MFLLCSVYAERKGVTARDTGRVSCRPLLLDGAWGATLGEGPSKHKKKKKKNRDLQKTLLQIFP